MTEMAKVQERIDAMGCWNLSHTVEIAKKELRCVTARSLVSTVVV
jgi:hypothetical protein